MKHKTSLEKILFGLILSIAIVVGLLSFRMVDSNPATAPLEEFSAERAFIHVAAISQHPHRMGSPENEQVRDYIIDELRKLNITAEVQSTKVPEYYRGIPDEFVPIYNVFAIIPGTDPTGTIALVGHYDTVPTSPGANDDGSAIATLLETARSLRAGPPLQNNILLLFSDAEEPGQYRYGARYFVDNFENIDNIKLVLNFEALGSSGPSIMFETAPGNDWLIKGFSTGTSNPVAFSFMSDLYRLVAKGSTDFIAFEEVGINGMDFAYPFERTVYHTAIDNPANLDSRSLQHHGDYATDVSRYYGNLNLTELAALNHRDYVFHSFFGNTLVYYPSTWAIPLAIICGVILALLIFLGIKRKKLTIWGVVLSTCVFALELIIITIITTLAWWGIDAGHLAFGIVVEPTIKTHLLFATFLLVSLALMVLSRKLILKRMSTMNRNLGPMLFWWLIAILAAMSLPGFSIVLVWPLIFSLAPVFWMIAARAGEANSWIYIIINSICVMVVIVITIVPVYLLFQALGVSSPGFSGSPSFPIIGLSIIFWVMLVSLLLPHLQIFSVVGRKRIIYTLLAVAFVVLIVGILMPGIDIETLGLKG